MSALKSDYVPASQAATLWSESITYNACISDTISSVYNSYWQLQLLQCSHYCPVHITNGWSVANRLLSTWYTELWLAVFPSGVKHKKISIQMFNSLFGFYGDKLLSVMRKLACLVIIVITFYYAGQYFDIKFQLQPVTVMSNIAFSKEGFARAVTISVYATTVMGMLSLAVEIFHSVIMWVGVVLIMWSVRCTGQWRSPTSSIK